MSRWSIMGPACRVKPTAYWADLCAEVGWMFAHGLDTADIGEALGVHEAVVARALTHAREARRNPNGGQGNAPGFGSTAQVNAGGGGVA